MKKLLSILVLVILIGCGTKGDDRIKTTYSDWQTQAVIVHSVENDIAVLVTSDKKTITMNNRNYKQGDRISLTFRYKYTSFCENGRCELLKTEAEIK